MRYDKNEREERASDPLLQHYQQKNLLAYLSLTVFSASMLVMGLSGGAQEKGKTPTSKKEVKTAPKPPQTGAVKPPQPKGNKPPTNPGRGVPPNVPGNVIVPGRVIIAPPNGNPTNPAPMPQGGTMMSFDFRGADILNVLKMFAQASGWNVTVDPALSGQVTILCPKQVKLEEAFQILQSVLMVRGFTAVKNGMVVSILPMEKGIRANSEINTELDKNGKPILNSAGQVVTQVVPIENVDAETMAKELAPLISTGASLIGSPGTNSLIITDVPNNIAKVLKLIEVLDKVSSNTMMKTYFLKRAEAPVLAEIVNNLYQKLTTRGKGGGAPQPGQPPPQPGQPVPSTGRPAVIAVADTRTNALIVVASAENQKQIVQDIISKLDEEDNTALETKVRKVKFADAQDVANLVNTVLNNMRPAGGSSSNPSFGSRFFGGFDPFGGGNQQQTVNSNDPFGKITADSRTNTLYISATVERMKKIDELIDSLDVNVPTETTTFIFPLKNVPAQDVAEALSQAFGTTNQNNNGFGGFFFGGFGGGGARSNQRRERINRRFGANQNNNNSFGRSAKVPPGPPNAPDSEEFQDMQGGGGGGTAGSAIPNGVQGVMTPNGFVPTQGNRDPDGQNPNDERTRQFYYDGYYGGGRRRGLGQQRGPQYGRGKTGTYSNLLQLQNNVFVTPAPSGDSLIVTTLPENYNLIKELIEKLDVVQRQVMIEVIIAEVTLDQNEKLGMALGGTFSRIFRGDNSGKAKLNLPASGFGSVFDATQGGMQFSLTGTGYDVLLQALNTDNKVKVLATPRIFTTNNQEAEIELVEQIPYVTTQNAGFLGGNQISQQVEFAKPGLYLNAIPSITGDGQVSIDLLQEASELLRFENVTTGLGAGTIRVPVTNNRRTNTLVTIKDGETVAIGGLMRETTQNNITKVPLLSEVPLFGQFFRSREKVKRRVELVVFLTPRIVTGAKEARDMTKHEGRNIIRIMPEVKNLAPILNPKSPEKPEKPSPAPTPERVENQDQN
jgi:general secretion pathway protein D